MSFDRLVSADLAALASESKRQLHAVDDSLRPIEGDAYRDDRLGARARRDELQARRRNELALMPLALGHVFVHRVARAAAGAAALAGALVVIAMLAVPRLFYAARSLVPGLDLALIVTILVGGVLAAYVGGTWIAEWVLERRMRRSIETTSDAHADIERLANGPIEIGRHLVRRVDGWAVGLAIAGSVAAAAIVGYLVYVLGATYSIHFEQDAPSALLERPVRGNLPWIAGAIGLAVVAVLVVARACDREHRRGPSALLKLLEHNLVAGTGVMIGVIAVYVAYGAAKALRWRLELPSSQMRAGLVLAGCAALVAVATWLALRWRRREEARIARCEPARASTDE